MARSNEELEELEEKRQFWERSSNTYKGKLATKTREFTKLKAKNVILAADLRKKKKPWAMKC